MEVTDRGTGVSAPPHWPTEATQRGAAAFVDLAAIAHNVAQSVLAAPSAQVLAVVKADAYGHGLVPCARAAQQGGATWLGTALISEAITLREAGLTGRILAWLAVPGADWAGALARDIDVSVSAPWALAEVAAAARDLGVTARVHLKIDTGLSRGGSQPADWPDLVSAAVKARANIAVVGLWSHFAYADAPGHAAVTMQLERFSEAIGHAEAAGLDPEVRHIANTAATFSLPAAHFDLVRPGIGIYGIAPGGYLSSPAELGLRPAMTLKARLALVKRVPAGEGVAYGHEYVTASDTVLGLVPLGYADGLPRSAGGSGPVAYAGRTLSIAGRISMDQVVLDLGPDSTAVAGDEVTLFGDGADGSPTAADWADAAGTIGYEIVTRIGPRVPRVYVGGTPG